MGEVERELRSIRVEIEKVLQRMEGRLMRPVAVKLVDAPAVVGLGATKFAQLVKRGDVPVFRVGTRVLVRVQDLEDWAARQITPISIRIPRTKRKTEEEKVLAALKKR